MMRVFYLIFKDDTLGPDGHRMCVIIANNETEAVNGARAEDEDLQLLELVEVESVPVHDQLVVGTWQFEEKPL
jgi:hypothetical protein